MKTQNKTQQNKRKTYLKSSFERTSTMHRTWAVNVDKFGRCASRGRGGDDLRQGPENLTLGKPQRIGAGRQSFPFLRSSGNKAQTQAALSLGMHREAVGQWAPGMQDTSGQGQHLGHGTD